LRGDCSAPRALHRSDWPPIHDGRVIGWDRSDCAGHHDQAVAAAFAMRSLAGDSTRVSQMATTLHQSCRETSTWPARLRPAAVICLTLIAANGVSAGPFARS